MVGRELDERVKDTLRSCGLSYDLGITDMISKAPLNMKLLSTYYNSVSRK